MPTRTLILASASPRRRELLALGGWEFAVQAADAVEIPDPGESPETFVRRMSATKARLVARARDASSPRGHLNGALIIGADTVVTIGGQILGKPAHSGQAVEMLEQLRGRVHQVLTGLTVSDTAHGQTYTDLACSNVPMRPYTAPEVNAYVATGDPLDKAGAYAIQHPDFHPVDEAKFTDCFANVMGLPLCHLLRQLRRLGVEALTDLPAACQQFIPYRCPVYEAILKEEIA
jgi:septum formation protein